LTPSGPGRILAPLDLRTVEQPGGSGTPHESKNTGGKPVDFVIVAIS
jgi:hypothetical protein